MSTPFTQYIGRTANDHSLLASAMAAYQKAHHLSDNAMAGLLNVAQSELPKLALCRRPDPTGHHFDEDMQAIVAVYGCDRSMLEMVLALERSPRAPVGF